MFLLCKNAEEKGDIFKKLLLISIPFNRALVLAEDQARNLFNNTL